MYRNFERYLPIHKLLHFSSPDAGALNWGRRQLPPTHSLYIRGAYCYTLYGDWGCMIFQHIPGNHFDIWRSYYDVRRPCTFYVSGDISLIECCFQLNSEKVHIVKPLHPVFCGELTYNFYYFSRIESKVKFEGNEPITTLDIHCHPEMLDRLERSMPEKIAPISQAIKTAKAGAKNKKERVDDIVSARVFREPQSCTPILKETLDRLLQVLHQQSAIADVRDIVYPLLHLCLAKDERDKKTSVRKNIPGIPELCDMMETDLSKRYTVARLARMACMNRTKLINAFKTETGLAPKAFYQKMIMDEAMVLIRDSTVSIKEISGKLGFASKHTFGRAFHNYFGKPPLYYRKK
ncbi:MAG: helix-turn-helix domain-containing protein [Niabella sp.]